METTVQVGQRGTITVPDELRRRHDIRPGDVYHLLDLDGVLVLSPAASEVAGLAHQIEKIRTTAGVGMDELMLALREQREQYQPESPDAADNP